jgi:Response regulator containing a CheY-like receiver domain and an HTH DNA-binding domain
MTIRLVFADDHPIVLDGLADLFRSQKDCQVVARCTSGTETLDAVRTHQPDLLILDVRMPGMSGIDVLRQMRKEKLDTKVVLLTANLDEEEVLEAVRLGVKGVVLKEMAPRLLIQCVRKVHEGGQWIEKTSIAKALDRMLRREAAITEVSMILSPRESEIVRLVAKGLRNKEIGEVLSISEGTVKIHLHNIYQKLDINGRIELSDYARNKGLV